MVIEPIQPDEKTEIAHFFFYVFLVLEHYRGKNIPVATVIGGGYSKDTQELAHRHGLIFESAINYL